MDITVEARLDMPSEARLRQVFGPQFDAFMRSVADDLRQTVRREMRRRGDPAGDWPQLSGYQRRAQARRTLRALKNADALGAIGGSRRGVLKRQAGRDSPHTAYARRKHEKKTPGRGKFGPGIKLRDTGALIASANGVVIHEGNDVVIRLVFDDTAPGRTISNEDLARVHFTGEGNMPKRSAVEDMSFWEEKVGRRIAEWVAERLKK